MSLAHEDIEKIELLVDEYLVGILGRSATRDEFRMICAAVFAADCVAELREQAKPQPWWKRWTK